MKTSNIGELRLIKSLSTATISTTISTLLFREEVIVEFIVNLFYTQFHCIWLEHPVLSTNLTRQCYLVIWVYQYFSND